MRAKWTSTILVGGLWLACATAASTQENTALSLKDVPVGIPTAAIIPGSMWAHSSAAPPQVLQPEPEERCAHK